MTTLPKTNLRAPFPGVEIEVPPAWEDEQMAVFFGPDSRLEVTHSAAKVPVDQLAAHEALEFGRRVTELEVVSSAAESVQGFRAARLRLRWGTEAAKRSSTILWFAVGKRLYTVRAEVVGSVVDRADHAVDSLLASLRIEA